LLAASAQQAPFGTLLHLDSRRQQFGPRRKG
jgi:hypothetical protein